MAPISPGKRAGPPRKARTQTLTEKSHRYEPFTKRVAKLKIDPVHKVQQSRLKETKDDLSQSYFRTALDEWSELNLTTTFTSFLNQVSRLSESLPQLLHHADQIAQSLLDHIVKQDSLSLEALLSLVAHLAHDLGQGFEKYFAQTVKLVAEVSTTQDDPAVIESCFTCLAWMYKYLSRLLVQDLRPLLDILLPYFSARKEYIRRFTAESLAFLVRKAAVLYPKNPKPLKLAIKHVLGTKVEGLVEGEATPYADSCMALLAESATGVDAGLHSSAVELYKCVYEQVSAEGERSPIATRVLEGLTVNLIHCTDASGFQPLLNFILESAQSDDTRPQTVALLSRLLLIAVGTRGGSRVSDWRPVLELLPRRFACLKAPPSREACDIESVVQATSASIQNAPLDQLLPFVQKLINAAVDTTPPSQFFTFCEAVARLGKTRFRDLLLPRLQQYIISRWSVDQAGLTILLSDLNQHEFTSVQIARPGYVTVGEHWETSICNIWRQHEESPSLLRLHLLLARSTHFPKSDEAMAEYRKVLTENAKSAASRKGHITLEDRVHLGWGLQTLQGLSSNGPKMNQQTFSELMSSSPDMFQLLPFVEALADFASEASPPIANESRPFDVTTTLVRNMLNASVELRKASLMLLRYVHPGAEASWLTPVLERLQEILSTNYTIGNARQLAMLIRRLPQAQRSVPGDTSLSTLIPSFALGLLPMYHDQLRKDVTSALSQMMTDTNMEDFVLDVIRDWLQVLVEACPPRSVPDDELPSNVSSFECTRLSEVESAYNQSIGQFHDAEAQIAERVNAAHTLLTTRVPNNSRLIALQVLNDIPQTAEKRSKILVPAFLAAQRGRAGHGPLQHDDGNSVNTLSPDIEDRGWSLRERKLFLQLIGQFNNPRVLYRADDVYDHLLELLSNGDPDVRKLALTALLKWKNRALVSHQNALIKVAEDKQTTSELGLMLISDTESTTIQDADRQVVLPVLLRLVFGQLIGRVGVHGPQEAKRKSLLRLLFRMRQSEILIFIDIVLGRLREVHITDEDQHVQHDLLQQDLINTDQQYGFLRMVASMLDILQMQFAPYGSEVVDAVLYCTTRACHQIDALDASETVPAMLRNIRRTGLQCLNTILQYCPNLSLVSYKRLLNTVVIQPRLSNFVSENTQGVSGLLKMFSMVVRSDSRLELFNTPESGCLVPCWGLLASEHAKDTVKAFVLDDIVGPLMALADRNETPNSIGYSTMTLHGPKILDGIATLLQQSPSKDLLSNVTITVRRLEPHVEVIESRQKVIELLMQILGEPNQRLPPHVKGQVLKAIQGMAEAPEVFRGDLVDRLFEMVSSYLDFFRDVSNRETCCGLLRQLAKDDSLLNNAADICDNLNAYSTKSLDDVDHDRQSAAFSKIHGMLEIPGLDSYFLPILHNLIFLMRTNDDTATRGSALGCIKNAVKCCAKDTPQASAMRNILLQAIRKHIKDQSETVRADFVEILGTAVQQWNMEEQLADMKVLLVDNDEEASFFTNILHIQQHRRTRAMRRLTSQVETGAVSAENIAEYFLPLLQKFAEDKSNTESALATKGQSVASLTILLQWLDWKTFRRVFRHYRQLLDQKNEDNKIDVRLLEHAVDALRVAVSKKSTLQNEDVSPPHLAKSLPSTEVIAQELKNNFIPKLAELSHYRDEGEVNQRIPAAVVAVKLIKLLPQNEIALLATPVVLDIAQVLRSRTQETRDLARNKLAEVVVLLGSSSIQFVLKELRTALTQGYQLHVLSYTMHTILLATAEQRAVGDLDYCIQDLVKVILDDIFGIVGQQKDNQDYVSDMKEVKRNKSFDSMEILAKCTSVKHLAKLVLPFEALLAGSLSPKQARHVDELFRRVGVGISHSPAANSQDLLVLAFELIQSFYKAKAVPAARPMTNDEKNRDRFIVQKDNTNKVGRVTSASLRYKVAKFAIDIARSSFARHTELMTPQNVHGFLAVIGDALVEAQEDVKISALRLLSTVIKLRMPELEENAKLYVIEAVRIVKAAVSTDEEAAQAALKLVAGILREKSNVEVRESDVAYLLKRTMPDLEEPDRQGITFSFVKAVMARRMQMPEIYELVDKIGLMMVTSQSRSSRDAARGVYVHFLLDYPQGKARWTKQVKFLVKNLEYQYPEGRQSIMEATSTLVSKIDTGTASELASVMFVPAVLRMANDDNLQCREMAGALLSQFFGKTPASGLKAMLEPFNAWLAQGDNAMLKKISLQAWNIYFKSTKDDAREEVTSVRDQLLSIIDQIDVDEDIWETKYQALELIYTLAEKVPQLMLSTKQGPMWKSIVEMLQAKRTWLQYSASKLISLLFRECVSAGNLSVPLRCSQGLAFDESTTVELLRSLMRLLKYQTTTAELAEVVVQNLLFLGRCVDVSGTRISLKHSETDGEEVASEGEDEASDSEEVNGHTNGSTTTSIPATQYLIDQAAYIMRREPPKQTSAALRPKLSILTLLTNLLPYLSATSTSTPRDSFTSLVIPLLHYTSTNTTAPRSSDSLFANTYQSLIEQSQLLLEAIQSTVGDQTYARLVTSATKQAREKRNERRNKRAIEVVAEPERAAKEKRRRGEKKKVRRKEVSGMHRSHRRRDLGF